MSVLTFRTRQAALLAASLLVSLVLHALVLFVPMGPHFGQQGFGPQPDFRLDVRILSPLSAAEPILLVADTNVEQPPVRERRLPPSPVPDPAPRRPVPRSDASRSGATLHYYRSSELEESARPIDPPVLVYPERAYRRRLAGTVVLIAYINASGRVDGIDVESAVPPGLFEQSAVQAVLATRFRAGKLGGRAVGNVKRIEIVFDPYENIHLP